MRVGSLFSGVGGLDLGLERAGMTVAWQCEKDRQARRVLRRHWPDVHIHEDVHDVREGSVDVICGGFPCQDYSVAGQRGGLAGDRGALWWEMHRIIAECRPNWVVGENVPGLLSSNGGRDFLTIIESLVQLGYGVSWATMDSQYFGVAQRRRRLFIVGHLGGVPRPEVLALSEGLFGHPAPSREAGETDSSRAVPSLNASGSGTSRTGFNGERGFTVSAKSDNGCDLPMVLSTVAQTLTANDGKGPGHNRDGNVVVMATGQSNAEVLKNVSPTLNLNGDQPILTGSPAGTLTAETGQRNNGTEQNYVQAKQGPRRLTPVECERLQGFPDGWTEYYADGSQVADGPRYRMMGNAVTVNVAEWIGQRIMSANEYS